MRAVLTALAVAVYMEVPDGSARRFVQEHMTIVSFVASILCLEAHCLRQVDACEPEPFCEEHLSTGFAGVLMTELTAAEQGVLACMLESGCATPITVGAHGQVHNVRNETHDLVWRESKATDTAESAHRAVQMAARATSFGCPGLVPLTDAAPQVMRASGLVSSGGFIMPRMHGNMQQWLAQPAHAAGGVCNESFARQAIGALECMHSHGYAHRDVHIGNFLFQDAEGCPTWLLADFELMQPASPELIEEDWRSLAKPVFFMSHGMEAAMDAGADRDRSSPLAAALHGGGDPQEVARAWVRDHLLAV